MEFNKKKYKKIIFKTKIKKKSKPKKKHKKTRVNLNLNIKHMTGVMRMWWPHRNKKKKITKFNS